MKPGAIKIPSRIQRQRARFWPSRRSKPWPPPLPATRETKADTNFCFVCLVSTLRRRTIEAKMANYRLAQSSALLPFVQRARWSQQQFSLASSPRANALDSQCLRCRVSKLLNIPSHPGSSFLSEKIDNKKKSIYVFGIPGFQGAETLPRTATEAGAAATP